MSTPEPFQLITKDQHRYATLAYRMAVNQGDPDPAGFVAQIFRESSFEPNKVGPDTDKGNAMGIAQFMPGTALDMGVKDPFNPGQALSGALRYRAWLRDKHGLRGDEVLAGYNAGAGKLGSGRAAKALAQFPDTQRYVAQINQDRDVVRGIMGGVEANAAQPRSPMTEADVQAKASELYASPLNPAYQPSGPVGPPGLTGHSGPVNTEDGFHPPQPEASGAPWQAYLSANRSSIAPHYTPTTDSLDNLPLAASPGEIRGYLKSAIVRDLYK